MWSLDNGTLLLLSAMLKVHKAFVCMLGLSLEEPGYESMSL